MKLQPLIIRLGLARFSNKGGLIFEFSINSVSILIANPSREVSRGVS